MLLPERAKVGDVICILYGCSVPVVLRRFDKTKQELEDERQQHMARESVQLAFTRCQKNFKRRYAEKQASLAQGLPAIPEVRSTPFALNGKAWGFHLRNDQGAFYELIGECYVHSMMDGEALESSTQQREFVIV